MTGGVSRSLDVVVVPDFSGTSPERFEARTLLFLAAWLEYGGSARRFPLHVVSIGPPPASVRALARACQASVHVVAPLVVDRRRASNKLRGLDIDTAGDRVLLLDADVLVLADFSAVADLGCTLSATTAIRARVPEAYWPKIYGELGIVAPDERVASLVGRLNCGYLPRPHYPKQNAEARRMWPYYNSGVVLAPRACDLRPLWEEHIRRIASMFAPGVPGYGAVAGSDQAGFATAVTALRRAGVPFTILPDRYHACWLHWYRRTTPLAQTSLFHALGLFSGTRHVDWTFSYQIEGFLAYLTRRLWAEWRRDPTVGGPAARFRKYLWPAWRDGADLGRRLRALHRTHIRPALAGKAR